VILTLNEETNLPACFESLAGLRCTRFVVDSGSTDQTVHPFENYAQQRNWALDNLPFDTPWILNLDADERLTPQLVGEINAILEENAPEVAGYLLRKRTVFMGRWIRHGGHYPTYHLRLFRRGSGRCEARLYDQHFIVGGAVKKLSHDYIDVVSSTLVTWTLRHGRWAEMEAAELSGPRKAHNQVEPAVLGNPIQRRRWWRNVYGRSPLFVRAFAYWFYRYFVRLGFLDGKEGLIFHFLQGLWFRFLVDAMICADRTEKPVLTARHARSPKVISPTGQSDRSAIQS
jgi:glycosyltransferase involved in cell wall biosynthesis